MSVPLLGSITKPARNQNFEMYATNTKDIEVTISDLVDLTGSQITWVLRKTVAGQQYALKIVGSGITILRNTFTISLKSVDTYGLRGRYYHEAQLTDVNGKVFTVMIGYITVIPSALVDLQPNQNSNGPIGIIHKSGSSVLISDDGTVTIKGKTTTQSW